MARDVPRYLLSSGTDKLGQSIYGFAIPAIRTCPGRSSVCSSVCYATHGRFSTRNVQRLMQWRFEESKKPGFAARMSEEVFRRGVLVCRVGVSGDFYSPAYVAKWIEIASQRPNTRFFAYTRSYRVPKMVPYLRAFAALDNVRLWYSADEETGYPADVPEGVRVAWLMHTPRVPEKADLLFQVRKVRAKPGVIPLPLVCGQETPKGKADGVNCSNCSVCWR